MPLKTYLPPFLSLASIACVGVDYVWGNPTLGYVAVLLAATGVLVPLVLLNPVRVLKHWKWGLLTLSFGVALQPWLSSPILDMLAILLAIPVLIGGSTVWRAAALLAAGGAASSMLAPEMATEFRLYSMYALASLIGGGLVLALLALASLTTRVGLLLAMFGAVGASCLALLHALPPSLQFNGLMVIYLLAFILATTAVASGVTFLFVKALESLSHGANLAFVWLTPILLGPAFFVFQALAPQTPGPSFPVTTRLALSLASVCLATWALLACTGALGRLLASRQLVADIAWKFLRSQRQVPTWRTRANLAVRAMVPSLSRPSLWRLLPETLLPVIFAVACIPFSKWVTGEGDYRIIVQVVGVGLAALFVIPRAFRPASLAFGSVRFLSALTLSLWLCLRLYFSPLALSPAFLWAAVGLAALPSLLLLNRGLLRLALGLKRRKGLPPNLDPRLAPPIVNRIAYGVGPSIFVSLVGVAVGVWALILVLSVMSGFSNELQQRIIKAKDHVMVKTLPGSDSLSDPAGLAATIARLPGVSHAAPYVEGEAMMSGAVNISPTVTLRGIDPSRGGLDFLYPILVAGDPEFLVHPETLLPFPGMQVENPLLQSFSSPIPAPSGDKAETDESETDGDDSIEPPTPLGQQPPVPEPEEDTDSPMPMVDGLVAMPDPDEDQKPDLAPLQSSEGDLQLLPSVVIGQELARALGAPPGTIIQVISPDGDVGPLGVQPRVRPFRVAGVFQTGMYEYDLKTAFVLLSEAQRFFNLGNDINHIDVRLADTDRAGEVAKAILPLLDPQQAEVMTWEEMNRSLFSALKLEQIMMFIVLGFIIIIASFNIVSSLILIIRRRLSAIAILKTMGAGPSQIMGIFLLLGFSAGLFGTFSGILLGLLSSGIVESIGITLPKEYYVRSIPVLITGWQVGAIAAASTVVTGLAALYPGRLGSKVGIVEGLKDER